MKQTSKLSQTPFPVWVTPPCMYSLFRLTLRLKDVCSLLMSFWTMRSKQWTPAEVKVWFSRRVFSYSMVSVQPPLGSGTHLGRKRQHTHMGGLKSCVTCTHQLCFILRRRCTYSNSPAIHVKSQAGILPHLIIGWTLQLNVFNGI